MCACCCAPLTPSLSAFAMSTQLDQGCCLAPWAPSSITLMNCEVRIRPQWAPAPGNVKVWLPVACLETESKSGYLASRQWKKMKWKKKKEKKMGWIIRYSSFETSCGRLLSCQVNQPCFSSTYPCADAFPPDRWCLVWSERGHLPTSRQRRLHGVASASPPANWVCQCSAAQLSGAALCLASPGREELA